MLGGALYGDDRKREGLIPWLLRNITQGNPDYYKNAAAASNAVLANPPTPAVNPGVLSPARSPEQDAVSDMDSSSATPMNLALQYMNSQGGQSYDMPDVSQALQQAQIDPRTIAPANDPYAQAASPASPFDFGKALEAAGRGLVIAQSKNPVDAFSKFAELDRQKVADAAGKFVPVAGTGGGYMVYSDGRPPEFVESQRAAQLMADIRRKENLPPGYRWSPTKPGEMEPIPGGPAAKKIEDEQQAKGNAARDAIAAADNVIDRVDTALGKTKWWTTGLIGAVTGALPLPGLGESYSLRSDAKTLKANLGFQQLKQMRDASTTGTSGLGQLAVAELNQLERVLADLDPNLPEEMLRSNLNLVRNHYTRWKEILQDPKFRQGGGTGSPASAGTGASPSGGSVENRAQGYLK